MSALVKNHDYPGYEALGDVFNISAATSFKLYRDVTIVATSGQIGEAADYSPFQPNGANNEQFNGGHAAQFELALKNIEKSLAAAQPHLSSRELWGGVFNMTSFHTGTVPQEDQLEIAAVARRYLGANKPAWAAIGVAALFPPKCLVEVQVQAAYNKPV
jgi:enamine deaminase RidA (YjgF/YER057c/UK114 family)